MNAFTEACIDDNSIRELIDAMARPAADAGDCREWGLTPTQWRSCIQSALAHKIAFQMMDAIPQGPWPTNSDENRRYQEARVMEAYANSVDVNN